MTTAREIMTPNATCIGENDTVLEAARRMAALGRCPTARWAT